VAEKKQVRENLLETEWSRATTRGSHIVMMPPDALTTSKATKEDVDEGRKVADLNVEGVVSLVSWRQITSRSHPMRLLFTSEHLSESPSPITFQPQTRKQRVLAMEPHVHQHYKRGAHDGQFSSRIITISS
jgi:hypothetical protein